MTPENQEVVKKVETEYPELTAEYKKIMLEQYILFCKKHSNYGCQNITLGTNLETEEDIQLSLTGLTIRLLDKINRLKTLVLKGEKDAVGESVVDTFQDLSVYGIIAQIVKKGKFKK
jgi:hypothetical protein